VGSLIFTGDGHMSVQVMYRKKRAHQFSGKHLIVKSSDPNEDWKVAWEHY